MLQLEEQTQPVICFTQLLPSATGTTATGDTESGGQVPAATKRDQKLSLPSLTAEVGPSQFDWQSSRCRDASTSIPPHANKNLCWQLRETHTHKRSTARCSLCTGTVQELGRNREKAGKGCKAGRGTGISERQLLTRLFQQTASRAKLYLQGLQPSREDDSASPFVF